MMTRRAWSFGDDRQVSATAMITTRAVPALLPAHHRRVARTHLTPKDFADPLGGALLTHLSVHESVDDLCKKAASLWAGREMLGIVAAAHANVRAVTWGNTIHILCTKEKSTLST